MKIELGDWTVTRPAEGAKGSDTLHSSVRITIPISIPCLTMGNTSGVLDQRELLLECYRKAFAANLVKMMAPDVMEKVVPRNLTEIINEATA